MDEDGGGLNEARITLLAPVRFDQEIGYWTGEPDEQALTAALEAVAQDPRVTRTLVAGGVTLSGPSEAVGAEAAALRRAGLA